MIEEEKPPAEEVALLKNFWLEVVKNRKIVKQAKIHLINKLSKQVKRFGSSDNKKKESLVDQISATKLLFADDVTKFCFLQPTDSLGHHFKTATTKDDFAKIKLCLTKPLKKATEDFQKNCPDWGKIGLLLEEHARFKKKKLPKRKKKSKDRLSQKPEEDLDPRFSAGFANEEEFAEFRPSDSKTVPDANSTSDSSVLEKGKSNEKRPNVKAMVDDREEDNRKTEFSTRSTSDFLAERKRKAEDCKMQQQGTASPKAVRNSKDKMNDLIMTKSRKRTAETIKTKSCSFTVETDEYMEPNRDTSEHFEMKKIGLTSNPTKPSVPLTESLSSPPERTLCVDPFFITSGNQGYLTSATLEKPTSEGAPKAELVHGKTSRNINRSSNGGGPRNRRERRAMNRNVSNLESFGKLKKSSSNGAKQTNALSSVKLHPSWEAKKCLAPKILPFQGKKVVFE